MKRKSKRMPKETSFWKEENDKLVKEVVELKNLQKQWQEDKDYMVREKCITDQKLHRLSNICLDLNKKTESCFNKMVHCSTDLTEIMIELLRIVHSIVVDSQCVNTPLMGISRKSSMQSQSQNCENRVDLGKTQEANESSFKSRGGESIHSGDAPLTHKANETFNCFTPTSEKQNTSKRTPEDDQIIHESSFVSRGGKSVLQDGNPGMDSDMDLEEPNNMEFQGIQTPVSDEQSERLTELDSINKVHISTDQEHSMSSVRLHHPDTNDTPFRSSNRRRCPTTNPLQKYLECLQSEKSRRGVRKSKMGLSRSTIQKRSTKSELKSRAASSSTKLDNSSEEESTVDKQSIAIYSNNTDLSMNKKTIISRKNESPDLNTCQKIFKRAGTSKSTQGHFELDGSKDESFINKIIQSDILSKEESSEQSSSGSESFWRKKRPPKRILQQYVESTQRVGTSKSKSQGHFELDGSKEESFINKRVQTDILAEEESSEQSSSASESFRRKKRPPKRILQQYVEGTQRKLRRF